MTSQRAIICIAGAILVASFAASQASAKSPPVCDFIIEINALRGGSPFVSVNQTKDITAKARIAKGSAVDGTTIDTMLTIGAIDGLDVIDSQNSYPIRLGVGKGGQGDKLTLNISQCNAGSIDFVATFRGFDDDRDLCEESRKINKNCK